MCVSALILSKGITFSYAGLAGIVMRGRYAGLTLPNPSYQLTLTDFALKFKLKNLRE